MKRDEQISYIVICAAMLLMIFWIIPTQIRIPEGGVQATVSPRLIPQICCWGMFALAAYKYLSTLHLADGETLIKAENYRLLFTAIIIITVGTLIMQGVRAAGWRPGAFWVGATVITMGSMWMTGERRWHIIIGFSVILSGVTWFLLSLLRIFVR